MHPHEAAAVAAQHAAQAAETSRALLAEIRGLLDRAARGAVVRPIPLAQANRPGQAPAVRDSVGFSVINDVPNAVDVYVGFGGRSAAPGSGLHVAAGSVRTFPWNAGDIELDADPGAAIAAPFEPIVIRYFQPVEAR